MKDPKHNNDLRPSTGEILKPNPLYCKLEHNFHFEPLNNIIVAALPVQNLTIPRQILKDNRIEFELN